MFLFRLIINRFAKVFLLSAQGLTKSNNYLIKMEHLKISGKFQETDKTSIDTYMCSSYKKGQIFEETESCMTCGLKVSLSTKLLIASGILIREVKSSQVCNITEGLEVSGPSIVMRFLLTDTEIPTHNVLYCEQSNANFLTTYKANDTVFVVILSKEFYSNLIHQTSENQKEFPEPFFNNTTGNLFETDLPINPIIGGIINEIKNCNRKGVFKRIFIENKVQELLLLQLELNLNQRTQKIRGLNEEDISKLYQAKLLLDTNFTEPPNLTDLSTSVLLSETKLRNGFKSYFGMSIKSYEIGLKMKYALELLQSNKHNITEVAYLSGYNGLVQFSTAFKKVYGCSPKKFQD